MAYFCQSCNSRYTWSQQAQTPGFCSTKCRIAQSEQDRKPSFLDQHISEQRRSRTIDHFNNPTPVELARPAEKVQRPDQCEICNITDYLGRPLRFRLAHKDGNTLNDRPSNLQTLCPNCYSQLEDQLNR